ncbi:hypothetical protein CHUAL_000413 [Chamberlinius hualienensis]
MIFHHFLLETMLFWLCKNDRRYGRVMYSAVPGSSQQLNVNAGCSEGSEANLQGTIISLDEQNQGCEFRQNADNNEKPAESMLQLLTAVNKASGNQPLHLDRTDISVVVDESFCVKSSGGNQRWQCNVCPKYYATKNNLVTHLLGHYGVKPFLCTVCNKTFNQATRLKFHMLSHKGNNGNNNHKQTYTCSICLRSFAQLMHLKRHVLTHENKQPYSCKDCAKGFALLRELQNHLELHKRQHDFTAPMFPKGEEPVADLRCEVCGRKFLFLSQMKDHMISHTQIRRFECAICKMKFLKVHHLKAHCLTHSSIRPHKCELCGRAFTLKGNLIRHLLTHSKERAFECEICAKRFSQRQTLKTHMVIHADAKPYSCPVCSKALARAHNLKSHMALHRNEKPYKCPLCNSAFTMKGNLHRHYKEKHKDAIKTTLNLDTQKTGTAVVLSSQYFGNSTRGRRDSDNSLFSFGNFSQSDQENSRKRKKTPKKRKRVQQATQQPQQQHHQNNQGQSSLQPQLPTNGNDTSQNQVAGVQGLFQPDRKAVIHPSNSQCTLVDNLHNSMLNYYCNDHTCACKFQGPLSYNQHLMHKLHTLHSAIDSLAINTGQQTEKVSALHMAIDEMANISVQRNAHPANFC